MVVENVVIDGLRTREPTISAYMTFLVLRCLKDGRGRPTIWSKQQMPLLLMTMRASCAENLKMYFWRRRMWSSRDGAIAANCGKDQSTSFVATEYDLDVPNCYTIKYLIHTSVVEGRPNFPNLMASSHSWSIQCLQQSRWMHLYSFQTRDPPTFLYNKADMFIVSDSFSRSFCDGGMTRLDFRDNAKLQSVIGVDLCCRWCTAVPIFT